MIDRAIQPEESFRGQERMTSELQFAGPARASTGLGVFHSTGPK